MVNLTDLSAREAADTIESGETSAQELAQAYLDRICTREGEIGAFEYLDPDYVIEQARRLDNGPRLGPLHGVPIGIKDTYDTFDMPTTYGSPIYEGNRPGADASVVALCRAAGAVIVGKTVTTEFAYWRPGKTRNPSNPDHTPGGSSSGSAAAVADHMLPLAFGSQTAASIIRPAAFCGVYGYKVTRGGFDTRGLSPLAPTLDSPGLFTRSLGDIHLLRSVLVNDDPNPIPRPNDSMLRVGLVRTVHWDEADAATRDIVEDSASRLADNGAVVTEPEMPDGFQNLAEIQNTIMAFEIARGFTSEYANHREKLSETFREIVETGLSTSYEDYVSAIALANRCRAKLTCVFEGIDVILAPSTVGEAPAGIDATGDPLFSRMWTLMHMPSLHLPLGRGANGLPVGVQVMGWHHADNRLVVDGQWMWDRLV
jgi:Asp-tRNA(Asn)/Glu-tRNA(Gln) amidotransferase A subunit family amidase